MAGPGEGRALLQPEFAFFSLKTRENIGDVCVVGGGGDLVSQLCAGEERETGMEIKSRERGLKSKGWAYEKYIPSPKED